MYVKLYALANALPLDAMPPLDVPDPSGRSYVHFTNGPLSYVYIINAESVKKVTRKDGYSG